jgi:hypothetical protein
MNFLFGVGVGVEVGVRKGSSLNSTYKESMEKVNLPAKTLVSLGILPFLNVIK